MRHSLRAGTLTVYLEGELDHHSAEPMRKSIDDIVDDKKPNSLVLDLSALSFMDSAGIGLIIGRYRHMTHKGGKMYVAKPPRRIDQLLNMSGIYKIAKKI